MLFFRIFNIRDHARLAKVFCETRDVIAAGAIFLVACSGVVEREGMTQAEIARMVDKSRSHVANLQRLLGLPEPVLDLVEAGELSMGQLQELVDKLQTSLVQHEHEDENTLYPLLTRSMPGEDPMAAMSHAHREIFRLIHLLARMSRDFGSDPATTPADEVQYQLIRLDTLVQLHFEQEEELFRYLDWR